MKFKTQKRYRVLGLVALGISLLTVQLSCETEKPTQKPDVESLVKSMTLVQKAQLIVGTGMDMHLPDSIVQAMPPAFRHSIDTSTTYGKMVTKIRTYLPGAAGVTSEYDSLGITSQALVDGPAGLRIKSIREGDAATYYATAFPIATLLASSWDTELIEEVGKAMGNEVLEYGADIILGPGMNIQRDPLCGRNFEYYSEDPLVTGKMAAAMVNGIQSNNVGTSIKHYAANNQETNRLSVNTIVSERALREIYLKGFEIAVKEAKPWTVMSSYNKINGTYASESNDLLTKILRDDWDFDGYVMTDWGGGSDPVAQMKAGNDMIQPGSSSQIETLINAVTSGELEEAVLDRNVGRILTVMQKTPRYKGYEISNKPDLEAHAQITRRAAAEGMILLENKKAALPLPSNIKHIAAFGNTSYDYIAGGTGSGDVNEAYIISLLQGLETSGYTVDANLTDVYTSYMETERANQGKPKNSLAALLGGKIPLKEMDVDATLASKMAKTTDIALITIGRNAGEGGDREAIAGDFYLTTTELNLIKNVSQAYHNVGKKAIVILNIGGVIETASWKAIPDAILCAWQGGQEGGNSVVDVISGKVNPSGKLAVSFPMAYEDSPSSKNFPGTAVKIEGVEDDAPDMSGFSFMQRQPWEVVYEDDIFVGYRYYNTFDIPLSYEFGYGKSYSTFEYSNLELSTEDFKGELTAKVTVTNSGEMSGREVVQLYAHAPDGKLQKPEATLVAFGKTKIIEPGNSETMTFKITSSELASFETSTSTWIVEAGTYTLAAGPSSRNTPLKSEFKVTEELKNGTVSKALVPHREIDVVKK